MATTEQFIGKPVLRKEDPELLTGQASYIDNWTMPGMVWMALARPPYVHATIDGIDTAEAAAMPGVVGVYTAADFDLGALPFVWPITEDIKVPVHYPLASDKVRFNGDAVAVVVAETREQAIDAAEVVAVTATELPAVIDLEEAAKDEVIVHDDLGTNVVVHWSHGGGGDQSIFESAPVIVEERFVQPRLIPNPIEPRGCLAYGVSSMDEWTLVTATQIPHIAKVTLAGTTGIPEQNLRVIAPDVGGGFGSKLNVYAEEALALALARKLRRPVKWIEGRRENYVATIHGRGVLHDCTLAGTEDGKILGLKFVELCDMGAYYQLLTPGIPELGGWVYMGPFDPAGVLVRVHGHRDQHHSHRRLPGGREAGGHVRGRADRRFLREADRDGSRRRPADEPAAAARRGPDVDHGPERRLRELRAAAGQGARPCGVRQGAGRAARPT